MTKIQRMEARIEEDSKIFLRINGILDALDKERHSPYSNDYSYPKAIGAIQGCLEFYGRREEKIGFYIAPSLEKLCLHEVVNL